MGDEEYLKFCKEATNSINALKLVIRYSDDIAQWATEITSGSQGNFRFWGSILIRK